VAETELERFCAFAGRFLTDEQGRALRIEPFQEQILTDYFDGARETIVLISKKNGKTSLFAGVAIWHAITTDFADVAILAASRDQAGKLLNQLTGYVKRNAELRKMLRITQRQVHCDRTSGKVAVMAADSDTLDGWGGTLALVDELGRHKTAENFGLLRDGLGPRDGQLVAISTAGDNEDSALGQIRASAHSMDLQTDPENPKHRHLRRGGFAYHEWALDYAEEADDLELVKLVNPASWLTLAELEARRDSPSMQTWQWQRFTCGLWVAGEESAISPSDWAACIDENAGIPEGVERVVVGVDIGYIRDCFAAVPAWKSPEGNVVLDGARVLVPPGDGTSIDIEDMLETCHAAAERWPGCTFAFDEQYGGMQLVQRLEREIPTSVHAAFPQNPRLMSAAAMGFAELISTRKLRHPDQAELSDHVLAAGARFVGEYWRFVKPPGRSHIWIDAAIAASMACHIINSTPEPRRSIYEQRFRDGESMFGAEAA
jgi:hypothetical protein